MITPQITTLDSGLRVITDPMPHLCSISIGVWVNVGARHEKTDQHGLAHLLEHMAFKGTPTRNAKDIAEITEDVGAMMNAYTGREQTCYYMRALSKDANLCADILADILQNSIFDPDELAREKKVIIQEIGEYEDLPDEVLFDNIQTMIYPEQSLGRPILGTVDSVQNMSRQKIIDYVQEHYIPENLIFAASGGITHDEVVALAQKYFHFPTKKYDNISQAAQWHGGVKFIDNDLEQAHIAFCLPSIDYYHEDYYISEVFCALFGGGMSSRLFQEVREKHGLAYSISAFNSYLNDDGSFGVYAGTDPEKVMTILECIFNQFKDVSENLTEKEVERAKAQLSASLLMGLESPASRSEAFVKQQFLFNRFISSDELNTKIYNVSVDDVKKYVRTLFSSKKFAFAVHGNCARMTHSKEDIKHYLDTEVHHVS